MENKKTLWVVTGDLYTDGDWYFDRKMFENHTSKYFENYLYEFTSGNSDSHSLIFRRVFDDMDDAVAFVQKFRDSIGGCHPYTYEGIVETINDVIQDVCSHSYGYGYYDGNNSTITIDVKWVETSAMKIKSILYED